MRILPPEGEGSFQRIKISVWDGSGNRKVEGGDLRYKNEISVKFLM